MSEWHLVESTTDPTEDDFFPSIARAVVELTGSQAAVIVTTQGGQAHVLARCPEQASAAAPFPLAGSVFDGLPASPGMFRADVPALLCGIPFEAGAGALLAASAVAGVDRQVIVGLVADEEIAASAQSMMAFAVQTAARVVAAAERDHEQRARRYRLVADAIGEVVWELDFATGMIEWSGPMGERFRYPALDAAHLDWWMERVHPDDRARIGESFDAAIKATDASWSGSYRFMRGDGTVAHVRDRCFFARDGEGRALKATGSLQDVSEIHDLEQRLALADRMASIGTLAAGIAHEINNPLTYILGNLDIVLSGLETPGSEHSRADLIQMLREAHQGAMRVSEIVRSMRVFARSEPASSKMADVDHVVESALAMAKNELRHRARLRKQLGAPPAVAASATTLVQAVLNLLLNAAQAIPEGQADRFEIAVTTGRDPDGRVFIEVRDTGEGMTAETMRRAFDPFFTTKQVGQGRGLGLSLVHSAVTTSGGEVRVSSAIGEGSTFRLLLPAADVALAPSGVVAPPTRGRILIVDDEAPVVRVLRRLLVKDHDVVVAASGREALEILRSDPDIDVVLCDVMMPDLTGTDLHGQLVIEAPSIAERFVFVTGGAFGERARAYVESTSQPSITKPFRSADLFDAIKQVRRQNSSRGAHHDESGDDEDAPPSPPERARHAS